MKRSKKENMKLLLQMASKFPKKGKTPVKARKRRAALNKMLRNHIKGNTKIINISDSPIQEPFADVIEIDDSIISDSDESAVKIIYTRNVDVNSIRPTTPLSDSSGISSEKAPVTPRRSSSPSIFKTPLPAVKQVCPYMSPAFTRQHGPISNSKCTSNSPHSTKHPIVERRIGTPRTTRPRTSRSHENGSLSSNGSSPKFVTDGTDLYKRCNEDLYSQIVLRPRIKAFRRLCTNEFERLAPTAEQLNKEVESNEDEIQEKIGDFNDGDTLSQQALYSFAESHNIDMKFIPSIVDSLITSATASPPREQCEKVISVKEKPTATQDYINLDASVIILDSPMPKPIHGGDVVTKNVDHETRKRHNADTTSLPNPKKAKLEPNEIIVIEDTPIKEKKSIKSKKEKLKQNLKHTSKTRRKNKYKYDTAEVDKTKSSVNLGPIIAPPASAAASRTDVNIFSWKKDGGDCPVPPSSDAAVTNWIKNKNQTPNCTVTSASQNKLPEHFNSSKFGFNLYNPPNAVIRKGLRTIVIDGSNVAYGHTNGRYFSVKGLRICIDYFRSMGHSVKAFVPQFRTASQESSDPQMLRCLQKEGLVIFTPSRVINGRRIVSYDDRFIVQYAAACDGIIVSNDNYRDVMQENPTLQPTIEQRLLMFTWVDDMIIFPPDPLGKFGPTLDEFLRFP